MPLLIVLYLILTVFWPGGGPALTIFGDHQKTMELENEIIAILKCSLSMHIVLLDSYKITYLVKWVCLHCTIVYFMVIGLFFKS